MNKAQLQNQINELKSKMVETQKEIDKLQKLVDKPENVRWRAEKRSIYWFIYNFGHIANRADDNDDIDNYNYEIGNYFKTKEEAENYKENLITKQRLKDLALRLNNGVEIDWSNEHQYKWHIYYDNHKLDTDCVSVRMRIGEIVCLDRYFLDIAKQEIGEEALIKLIKSGV